MLKLTGGIKNAVRNFTSSRVLNATPKIAVLQEAALEERCILVDENDRQIGNATKRDCHKIDENKNIPLHRAFSVFLFNQKGDLLLQKRSSSKITFPGYYTNTCCSHPLDEIPGETDENNAIGIKRAARRRLTHELGIPSSEIDVNEFFYLSRIHYKAMGHDDIWGEHEIDYILFLKKNKITINPNVDEVSDIQWVSLDKINEFTSKCDAPLTPWFQLILTNKLKYWWENLDNLEKVQDHKNIQRF